VTHDNEVGAQAERLLLMRDGRVVEDRRQRARTGTGAA
jgi:predicted ABC-type transport system involved in lysophospholipase L1 biosynthesis ATPase subunit